MPITIEKATAKCKDCGAEIKGKFTILVLDWSFVTNIGYVKREGLVPDCIRHHLEKGESGEDNEDRKEHNEFVVYDGKKIICTMRVTAVAFEYTFEIIDLETYEEFVKQSRRLQEAYRRY